ncbi:MAG: endonuclease/exonuclease/phosphatase family protein [Anaerolineales bacterium]|nr:MAG: endonuclease/exonuclease/phosphatase family protein [Anaerolineales bacterium]
MSTMKVLSWNVAYRVRKQKLQLDAVLSRNADVIGLQEVTAKTYPLWAEGLGEAGYPYLASTFDKPLNPSDLKGPRRSGLLIASKWPLKPMHSSGAKLRWPERLLSAVVAHPNTKFEFHVAHIPPGSSHNWLKIETFNGIYSRLAKMSHMPRILCGDFNSPQAEFENGEVVTWGQSIRNENEVRLSERYVPWDEGERSVLQGLAKYDLPDIFRLINGYARQDFSWVVRRQGKIVSRRRFDHIFAAIELNPVFCEYVHAFRDDSLSDHSAIEAKFEI